eukprot:gene11977-51956_t
MARWADPAALAFFRVSLGGAIAAAPTEAWRLQRVGFGSRVPG